MPDPKFIEYIPDPDGREVQVFPQHYFSGCDVEIKMNNIKVAQIASFQYMIQEQHKPIYGYASRTFDEMSIGNRIVVGSFRVAIKYSEYIHQILQGKDPEKGETAPPPFDEDASVDDNTPVGPATPPPAVPSNVDTSANNCGWPKVYYRLKQPMMRDSNISKIQQKLKDLLFNPGAIDSWFGKGTEEAIKVFQKANGLTQDGVVGPQTWSMMFCGTPPAGAGTGGSSAHVCDWPNTYFQLKTPIMKSSAIGRIQTALNSKGYKAGSVDNSFGPTTKAAVVAFQKKNGLTADGVVGQKTWHQLFHVSGGNAGGTPSTPPSKPSTYPGKVYKYTNPMMRDDNVKKIQNALKSKGHNPGTADGWFGTKTRDAVIAFQSKLKLSIDGAVGPTTWAKLIDG